MQDFEDIINAVKDELGTWRIFLNNTVGVLAFSFGLSSLGTSRPMWYAWASLGFLTLVSLISHKFSKTLDRLRQKRRTEAEEVLLKGLEKHFLGSRALVTEYTVFLIGLIFLGAIALGFLK